MCLCGFIYFSHVCNWTLSKQAHNKIQGDVSINICLPCAVQRRQTKSFLTLCFPPREECGVGQALAIVLLVPVSAESWCRVCFQLICSDRHPCDLCALPDAESQIKGKGRLVMSKHTAPRLWKWGTAPWAAAIKGICHKSFWGIRAG